MRINVMFAIVLTSVDFQKPTCRSVKNAFFSLTHLSTCLLIVKIIAYMYVFVYNVNLFCFSFFR